VDGELLAPPTYTRTEERAPVWGFEFTKKIRYTKGGFNINRCWAKTRNPLENLSLIWNSYRKNCRWP